MSLEPLEGKDCFDILNRGIKILESMGLKYWISAGTALGLYRDGDFIPHDTDIDVEILLDKPLNIAKLQQLFEADGFKTFLKCRKLDKFMQVAFMSDTKIIFDIYIYYDE